MALLFYVHLAQELPFLKRNLYCFLQQDVTEKVVQYLFVKTHRVEYHSITNQIIFLGSRRMTQKRNEPVLEYNVVLNTTSSAMISKYFLFLL